MSQKTLKVLADLDAQIYEAHAKGAHLFPVFFDMENAFPRVWNYHICKVLHQIGLRGTLPQLLQNFLTCRTFKVRVADKFSDIKSQQNGIPQGSPLSGTLFLIAINNITKIIKYPFETIILADDLSIHLRSNNPKRAHRILQDTIDKIHTWLSSKGFQIFIQKTKLIIFQKPRTKSCTHTRLLTIANTAIPQAETVKILGLLFHNRHSWIPHIKAIKAKCLRALNILKVLSHPTYGCHRKILLPLYTSLVRSILDYGSSISGLASPAQLKLLDTIQNSALHTATGAFRTSPAVSLCAETGIPPLQYRRLTLTAKFLTTILQHPKTSTYHHIFHPPPEVHPDNNLRTHLERQLNHNFKFQAITPIYSTTPSWTFSHPTINFTLTQYSKSSTPSSVFKSLFQELIHSIQHSTLCFTDGSKSHSRTGFAYSIQNSTHSHRHRNSASVYTTELQAIHYCLQRILSTTPSSRTHPILIVSDSLAALNAISQPSPSHPLITHIHILFESCTAMSIPIVFIWAPGHKGIPGNEKVDKAAKQATQLPTIRKSLLPSSSDLFSHIKKWFTSWKNERIKGNKLAQLKEYPIPWISSNLQSKSQEITLTRLRLGHTRLTHTHLISHLMPLSCTHCDNDLSLTVDHFFECPNLTTLPDFHKIPHNRISALTDQAPSLPDVFPYLRSIGTSPASKPIYAIHRAHSPSM